VNLRYTISPDSNWFATINILTKYNYVGSYKMSEKEHITFSKNNSHGQFNPKQMIPAKYFYAVLASENVDLLVLMKGNMM